MSIKRLVSFVALAAALHAGVAVADLASRVNFNIGPQPLSAALLKYSEQSRIQVTSPSELVDGRNSSGVVGELAAQDALARLLEGTELSYEVVDENTVAIRGKGRGGEDASTGMGERRALMLAEGKAEASGAGEAGNSQESTGTTGAEGQIAGESDQNTKLEEIVVTAQRREERLLDTPISIGVLSGEELDRSSSRGVADILNQVGGVSVLEVQPGNAQISIRGVVPDTLFGASTTGYYLDEIPFAFNGERQMPDANAFDLARVEVLRGPQGTLYGANALSGVVRVLTNDANPDALEGKGRVRASDTAHGAGNYGGDLAINVPLIPGELAVRAVASYSQLSGYIDSTLLGQEQRRINDSEAQAYRLKVNYKPSDNLSIKLGITRSQIENGAPSQSFADLTTPFSGNQSDERVYDTYNLIAEFSWPAASLLSSTGYLDYRAETQQEIDIGSYTAGSPFFLSYLNRLNLYSFSQEFRLASHQDGQWQWSAGAFYKNTLEEQYQLAPAFSASPYDEDLRSESYAVFGEWTRSFFEDRFELKGGLRYFQDRVMDVEISNFFSPGTAPRRSNFDRVTGRLILTYKPQSSRMYYASVATGFRSGLNNGTDVTEAFPEFADVKPDSLITYEMGAKGAPAGGVFTYDVAVYFTDWKDIQQNVILPGTPFAGAFNAATASGAGVDGSVAYHPTRALSLRASLGWNGLEFEEDVFSAGIVAFPKDTRINNSADWTGSFGGSYRVPAPAAGVDFVLSSGFAYRSGIVLRALSAGTTVTTESQILRTLKASFGLEGDRWSVDVYGDNLLNDHDAVSPPDFIYATNSIRQRPRTIGLQGTFSF